MSPNWLAASAVFLALLWPSDSPAQSLEQIIARNLQAKGGVERLRGTDSARMRATVTLAPQKPGLDSLTMQVTVSTRRPNLVRRDMMVGGARRSMGFDGSDAWQAGPDGAFRLEGPAADAIRSEGEFDSVLLTYREQGHQIDLAGQEKLDGRTLHLVRVKRKEGPVQTYYLDAETGLEHKVVTEIEAGGQRITSEMLLSDYRTVDGRTMPFRARQIVNGQQAAEIVFKEIEFNVPFEDGFFRMPAK